MSIRFNQVIIHSLQLDMGQPIISNECLVLTDEIEAFVTKKISEVFDSVDVHKCKFESQVGLVPEGDLYRLLNNGSSSNFKAISILLANKFFNYMCNYDLIENGDLVVMELERDGESFIGVLKLNHKKQYMNSIGEGESVRIIQGTNTYENKTKEAALINTESLDVIMLDNSKEKYLGLLLEVNSELSVSQKLALVEMITREVIEEHLENPTEAITILKSNIAESIFESSQVPVAQVIRDTFKEFEEVTNECIGKLEECGIGGEHISISTPKLARKYTNHKLKTNTGVEIKLPTDMMNNPNFIEMVNNPDGTISIVIKNIGQIINK